MIYTPMVSAKPHAHLSVTEPSESELLNHPFLPWGCTHAPLACGNKVARLHCSVLSLIAPRIEQSPPPPVRLTPSTPATRQRCASTIRKAAAPAATTAALRTARMSCAMAWSVATLPTPNTHMYVNHCREPLWEHWPAVLLSAGMRRMR